MSLVIQDRLRSRTDSCSHHWSRGKQLQVLHWHLVSEAGIGYNREGHAGSKQYPAQVYSTQGPLAEKQPKRQDFWSWKKELNILLPRVSRESLSQNSSHILPSILVMFSCLFLKPAQEPAWPQRAYLALYFWLIKKQELKTAYFVIRQAETTEDHTEKHDLLLPAALSCQPKSWSRKVDSFVLPDRSKHTSGSSISDQKAQHPPSNVNTSDQSDTRFPGPAREQPWSFRISPWPRQSFAPGLGLTAEPDSHARGGSKDKTETAEKNVWVFYTRVIILAANKLATAWI